MGIVDPQGKASVGFCRVVEDGQIFFQFRVLFRAIEAVERVAAGSQFERSVEKQVFRMENSGGENREQQEQMDKILHSEILG